MTDVSGRGVGMDVVRKNIDKLRGKINMHLSRVRVLSFLSISLSRLRSLKG